ncbi:FtsQ-type POTRA domain-containing protein [Candidatus Pelagibacter sp.]|nr:FtsQ-type POTRA domain-containing protein [Candidatus Pelagibacter sp.]
MNVSFPKISKVEINGLNLNERKKIENIIYDSNFKNIFQLDKEYLEKKINSINIIEEFEIFKNYPSTLKIVIEKTKIIAQTKKNGIDYLIGSNGKLIENKDFISEVPFIFGDLDISEFLNLKKKIDSSLFEFSEISNLYLYKSNRWDIETRKGNLIKLPKNNVEEILNLYIRMSNEKKINDKSIIDFRQKNQIILNEK